MGWLGRPTHGLPLLSSSCLVSCKAILCCDARSVGRDAQTHSAEETCEIEPTFFRNLPMVGYYGMMKSTV